MEFIELANQGNELAVLNGWTFRTTTGSSSYNATITSLMIQPGETVVLANDADALGVYEDGTVVDLGGVLDRSFYFPNSGAPCNFWTAQASRPTRWCTATARWRCRLDRHCAAEPIATSTT